jgi:hypothetical protein
MLVHVSVLVSLVTLGSPQGTWGNPNFFEQLLWLLVM